MVMARIVVGISGASGIVLAHRAISLLASLGHTIELVMTKQASLTALEEMGKEYATSEKFVASFPHAVQEQIQLHALHNFSAPIASGSYQTMGMLLLPCSMTSLAAIACGLSDNLLRRAADVTLKEKRKLVIVPREAPLHEIHLENMLKLARAGATIVPPVPAWYTRPQTLADMENAIVGRVLDAMGIETDCYPRWGEVQSVLM